MTRTDTLKVQHMGTKRPAAQPIPSTSSKVQRPNPNPNPNPKPALPARSSDDDFLTEDEGVNQRLAARKKSKEQNEECFTSALRDYGITKTMEQAAG